MKALILMVLFADPATTEIKINCREGTEAFAKEVTKGFGESRDAKLIFTEGKKDKEVYTSLIDGKADVGFVYRWIHVKETIRAKENAMEIVILPLTATDDSDLYMIFPKKMLTRNVLRELPMYSISKSNSAARRLGLKENSFEDISEIMNAYSQISREAFRERNVRGRR